MSNATAPPVLLNPLTPLAFLDPQTAKSLEASRYSAVAALGVYIWDCGINLENDYRLLFKYPIRYATVGYYLSRISDCQKLQITQGIFYIISTGSTSFLFLLRVVAVWNWNKWITATFTVLWLATIGVTITVPVGFGSSHIGTTQACLITRVADYTEFSIITALMYDSAVVLSITYRILMNSFYEGNPSAHFKAFIGNGRSILPKLSKHLLRSGQQYYLVALSGNAINLLMLKLPNIPALYHAMSGALVAAIVNCMACIVFRQIKFGLITVDGTVNYQSFGDSRLYQ
ncbi:hypothetical protein L218DRAFT_1035450 [Marasmius fiardii PR-910]|nr:hypothetical protein L218DRAFT_1035450 [Marasmius fiardii PR-910]